MHGARLVETPGSSEKPGLLKEFPLGTPLASETHRTEHFFAAWYVEVGDRASMQACKHSRMWPYRYAWNRMGRKGQHCRVLVRGRMNSCLVEFEDGFRAVTSRNAIRKRAKDEKTRAHSSTVRAADS